MINKRVWTIANVSLVFIALILTMNLFEFEWPSVGKPIGQLETESFCVMKNWENEFVVRDINSCCLEKKKVVLNCEKEDLYYMDQTLQWQCFTGSKFEYYFNTAGYNYCKKRW